MLKVRKETMKEAQKKLGLTTAAWAQKLGLEIRSYYVIYTSKNKTFTIRTILKAQELSDIPIQNFFEEKR